MGKRKSLNKNSEKMQSNQQIKCENDSELISSGITANTSDVGIDEELQNLAEQASKMAKKLKKSPKSRLSLNKEKPIGVKIKKESTECDVSVGSSPRKTKMDHVMRHEGIPMIKRENIDHEISACNKEAGDANENTSDDEKQSVSDRLNTTKTPRSRGKKIPSNKHVKFEAPEGYSLSGCNEGQLWAEDVEGSELWLVRMPAEFDVNQLKNTEPLPGSSLEVNRFTKDKAPYVVEIQAMRNDTKKGCSLSAILPSRENKAPKCVGSFVGEIQVTSHVITKPYLVETLDRKKRELPKGLKMRNVPFGTGVEGISLSQREEISLSSHEPDNLSHRKKKKKRECHGDNDGNMKDITSPDKVENSKNEFTSNTNSQQEYAVITSASSKDYLNSSQSPGSSKLKKKKKKHKRKDGEYNQEVTSERTLKKEECEDFDSSPSKKRKLMSTGGSDSEDVVVFKEKKKHKDKGT